MKELLHNWKNFLIKETQETQVSDNKFELLPKTYDKLILGFMEHNIWLRSDYESLPEEFQPLFEQIFKAEEEARKLLSIEVEIFADARSEKYGFHKNIGKYENPKDVFREQLKNRLEYQNISNASITKFMPRSSVQNPQEIMGLIHMLLKTKKEEEVPEMLTKNFNKFALEQNSDGSDYVLSQIRNRGKFFELDDKNKYKRKILKLITSKNIENVLQGESLLSAF